MENKIDIDDENKIIQDKIETFCSVLMKMPLFPNFVIVSEEKKLELVKSDIISDLFSDLEKKNKFTGDKDVCYETRIADTPENPLSFDEYQSKFEEMTNREFLKKFIKQMINLNKPFRAMPKWKRISGIFLGFVAGMSGITNLIVGRSAGSKLMCFLGFLIMCAWAGLICSLVFHLSLAVLIPSAIVLGFATIYVLVNIVGLQVGIYEVRQKQGKNIDKFFNLVDEINKYLDTHDLPSKEISSGGQIFNESQIEKKTKNANTKNGNEEENDSTTEKNGNEEQLDSQI